MTDEHKSERFLARWSRLKTEQPAEATPPAARADAPVESAEPPPLPDIEELTIDSDFRGFLHPKVGEDVRRAALRKLFSDPHFNVMDGLDVYIDDYSKTEPIPPAMLAGLKQAQRILRWAEGKDDEDPEQLEVSADENPPEGALPPPDATAAANDPASAPREPVLHQRNPETEA
jgi:hypothetical protein